MREVGLGGWLVFGSLVLSACMVDLTPDVGSLIARGNEPVSRVDAGPDWTYLARDAGSDGGADVLFPDEIEPTMDAGSPPRDGAVAQGDGDLPDPPEGVELVELPPRKVAVVSFSGVANDRLLAQQEDRLRGWLARRGEMSQAEPEYAFYNSPMIPGPLRRNEVWLALS